MDSSNAATIRFGGATPIFRVRNLQDSIDYYVTVLGFKLEWEHPGIIASVSRDRCGIFLCEGDQGNSGAWVWIGVGNTELLFEAYRRSGARIRHPPTNYAWAYEMQIEDPDGNVLRFGSDPKTDEPFGEWLDMNGRRWLEAPNGGWTQVGHS
jgi:catechol 2,3-dioxygenase-like lactoylglutathione lyase family enzyme